MARPIAFYAWQNDRPRATVRDLIRSAADAAIARLAHSMEVSDSPRLDHDTLGEAGTPPISETIFQKIRQSAIFIADVTFVGNALDDEGRRTKRLPNPNVMVELGFAAAVIGWQRVILVMNKKYGSPESLPFDLKNRRFPITFELGPESERVESECTALTDELAIQIRSCLSAEYELVESTLAQLSSFARKTMREHGANQQFWETQNDNNIVGRIDLAIAQMLDLRLIHCVDATTTTGFAYSWTYLGQQCCRRLGVVQNVAPQSDIGLVDSVFVDMSAYDSLRTNDTRGPKED
jgi:hypothetical protein